MWKRQQTIKVSYYISHDITFHINIAPLFPVIAVTIKEILLLLLYKLYDPIILHDF